VAERSIGAKEVDAEEFFDGAAAELSGGIGAEELVKEMRGVDDAEVGIEADKGAADGGQSAGDAVESSLSERVDGVVWGEGIKKDGA
jgi:hypothetical protein